MCLSVPCDPLSIHCEVKHVVGEERRKAFLLGKQTGISTHLHTVQNKPPSGPSEENTRMEALVLSSSEPAFTRSLAGLGCSKPDGTLLPARDTSVPAG